MLLQLEGGGQLVLLDEPVEAALDGSYLYRNPAGGEYAIPATPP